MDKSAVATVEEESKDWINELPDCILSYIISLLTIKDAAATSIVCRRWRNLWKTRSSDLVLDIVNIFGSEYADLSEVYEGLPVGWFSSRDLESDLESLDRRCYIKRVKKVLELLSCYKLDLFKVAFFLDRKYTNHLDKWVRFAITKGAQKLDLRLYCYRDHFYVFPHWILEDLNVSTLKHLSLYRCVLKPPTGFDRFVQLTTLCLREVQVNPDFMAHLFSACSLLESLTLNECDVGSNILIIGPSFHLHDLKVRSSYGLTRLEIDAVNLSCLEYSGHEILMRTPKLVTFFYETWDPKQFPNVLSQLTSCPELSTLHLQGTGVGQPVPQTCPTLRNLKQVKLDVLCHHFEVGSALNILRAAPLLEELVMTSRPEGYVGEMRNLSTISHDHLRRVKMQGFQGKCSEIELAISLLKVATKLEVMVIEPLGSVYEGDGSWLQMTCRYQDGNEDETIDDISKDENVDNVPYELLRWQKRGRAAVQEALKEVKTDAQVIIL